jgi:ribosomal protein S18 acetylase RimI-like enzyme
LRARAEEFGSSGDQRLRAPEIRSIAKNLRIDGVGLLCVHAPTMQGPGDRCLSRRVLLVIEDITIRPVRESEFAAAGEATARAYREFQTPDWPGGAAYVERIADVAGRARVATVLVAVLDGLVVGSATLELAERIRPSSPEPLAPDEAHLRMVGVSPEHRGRGIARRLVNACVEVARAAGKARLTLETAPVMVDAQRLYMSMGFMSTGERRLPDGSVLLGYELRLATEAPATR